jgi:hypothetical protein
MRDSTESTAEERTPGFGHDAKSAESSSDVLRANQRQLNPQQYPHLEGPSRTPLSSGSLGEPLSINEVAELLGCSPWTVRQRYVPQGVPHFRACASGKLGFFREQVIGWILKRQQQKGGTRK